jgi:nucleoside-diphosphate-sugar epimerase
LPVTTLRYFNVYGPGERPGKYRNVIPNFFKWAMDGIPLPITGTGSETRTFTFVTDVIDATLRAALNEDAIGECFNISSDNEIQIIDLADKINNLTGNKAVIRYAERRKWDSIKRRSASYEKAKRILGYQPWVNIDEGLKLTYDWFLELKAKGKL